MTKRRITRSGQIGQLLTDVDIEGLVTLSHLDCIPVWEENNIILWDMYYGFNWIGSKRLLHYCEEVNDTYASQTKV